MSILPLISEAVRCNICKPDEFEKMELTSHKDLRASQAKEGDSQIGILLFIGIAHMYRHTKSEIMDYIGVETDEFEYKSAKFITKMKEDDRFKTKVKLINNYLKIKYNVRIEEMGRQRR